MIPYKFNPLGFSNKKSNNISSFKIQGDSLTSMYITPVEECVVDFGDGTKQTLSGIEDWKSAFNQIKKSKLKYRFQLIKLISNAVFSKIYKQKHINLYCFI